MVSRKQKKAYVKDDGVHCPYCKSQDIQAGKGVFDVAERSFPRRRSQLDGKRGLIKDSQKASPNGNTPHRSQ
jgi:hypothetical protein